MMPLQTIRAWRVTAAKEKYHHGDLRSALLEAALAVISEIGPQGLSIRVSPFHRPG
jgi:hypothetical protein